MIYLLCIILIIAMPAIYLKTGLFKKLFHDILGWHLPDDSPQWCDGCSIHSTCRYCGADIMQDSQGNWF